MPLIEEIKEKVTMEIRPNSREAEYLEAVIHKKDLEPLIAILTKYLGPAAKKPGQDVTLPERILEIVGALGNLWSDQSFFYKEEEGNVLYAALWPWASDPEKITVKAGVARG